MRRNVSVFSLILFFFGADHSFKGRRRRRLWCPFILASRTILCSSPHVNSSDWMFVSSDSFCFFFSIPRLPVCPCSAFSWTRHFRFLEFSSFLTSGRQTRSKFFWHSSRCMNSMIYSNLNYYRHLNTSENPYSIMLCYVCGHTCRVGICRVGICGFNP